jgi:hypothetical protein
MRALLVAAALLALAGCSGKEDGKPPPAAAGFQLDVPGGPVEVLNGQTVKRTIEVQWKGGTRDDVTLRATVTPADQGVSVKLEPATLPGGQGTAQAVIHAGETARAGDYRVSVTGKTASGGSATAEVVVKVPPID